MEIPQTVRNVLITGGAGFIGSHITDFLLDIKDIESPIKFKVRILDNLSTGNRAQNVEPLLKKFGEERLEFMYGDITDLETCRRAVKDIDVICHQAALGSVPRSVENPLASHKNNVDGFINLIWAAKEAHITAFIYASSSSVYGDNPTLPKREGSEGSVLSPYAATKAIDEIYASVFARCYGIRCIGLRYFNIFGPRQDPKGAYAAVIPKFIDLLQNNKAPTINGDGSYSRDFTYVKNAAYANYLAIRRCLSSEEMGGAEVYNIGAGGQTTILKLFEMIQTAIQSDISVKFAGIRPGDIPHSNADIYRAQSLLNYTPLVTFEDGIYNTVQWFLQK